MVCIEDLETGAVNGKICWNSVSFTRSAQDHHEFWRNIRGGVGGGTGEDEAELL